MGKGVVRAGTEDAIAELSVAKGTKEMQRDAACDCRHWPDRHL
jgi:hypothetical protein